jgi:hypothetical protein
VKQLARHLYRAAMLAVVVVLLASTLAEVAAVASPSATSYTLTGYVEQPGPSYAPVPAGVQVDLVERSSGSVYTTTVTGRGGEFSFTSAGTSSALAPGYWSVYVPTMTNVSLSGCPQCAVLPSGQNPTYQYFNTTELTNSSYATIITGVQILLYNATLNGTVLAGLPVDGASVKLLAPEWNGAVLANATTNATGNFSLEVPWGTWVLQSSHTSGSNTYTNSTRVTIASQLPPRVNPVLRSFSLSGHMNVSLGGGRYAPVQTAGNATLFDPTNGYIYTYATPPGGYYSLTPYAAGFTYGANTFEVVLSSANYQTASFSQAVPAGGGSIVKNVTVNAVSPAALGNYLTTLNFSQINTTKGTGSLKVTTTATLGNESVFPQLPNASVGQLWAQLGLDYNHSLVFPSADLAKLKAYVNGSGPFFPAYQALTEINGTPFYSPNSSQGLTTWTPPAGTSFGLSSAASLGFSWVTNYTLNGTLAKNSSQYSISFVYQHPTAAQAFNYTVVLPAGYQLTSGTAPPAHTSLVPDGPGGTWTSFSLISKPGGSASATAKFTIVKYSSLTVNVNVSSANFTFSHANILNSTHGYYSVVAGIGENLTFSALNSTYPSGTNGTLFQWTFGDGGTATTTSATTNHTYAHAAVGSYPFNGTVKVTSSGGLTNTTNFSVYILTSGVTAKIWSNATSNETFNTSHPTEYLKVNWSTTLAFSSNGTVHATPNKISIAAFSLSARNFSKVVNYTVASGGNTSASWSFAFDGAGVYLSHGNVSGILVPIPEGWQYNLTLTVWAANGQSSSASLVILVNDTEKPVPAFKIQSAAGSVIPSSGVVVGANGHAAVYMNGANSSDPHGGSIKEYSWHVNNSGNSSLSYWDNVTSVSPYPEFSLTAQSTPYTVNLTVEDLNGNKANATESLTVSVNSTITPIMDVANLTGPTSLTAGTSATFWVNVTVGGGVKATALNVTVSFYLLSSSGTGSRTYIGSSPGSVEFYNYTSKGVVNSAPFAQGLVLSLAHNKTVRAQITWTPSKTGNFILYANATATNVYLPDEGTSNVASMTIAVHQNPTIQYLEYGGIAAAVILVIVGLIWWFRRPKRAAGAKGSSGKGGLERGSRRSDADEDDES